MRVLVWSETFWPLIGGLEVLTARLLPALQRRGYEFMVITRVDDCGLPCEAWYGNTRVHRLPFWSALSGGGVDEVATVWQQVTTLKRQFAPDVVHVHSQGPSVLCHLRTTGAHPAPDVLTLHRHLGPEAARQDTLAGRMVRSASWVTGVSGSVLSQARQLVPEIRPRSSLIHNALEVPAEPPALLSFDAPRVLCLGRLVPEKGFDVAVTAFASVAERFPAARLVIAGDGPARQALQEQAATRRLAASVEFLGWVAPDAVPALLNAATIVVIPSRWAEPFALAALEAARMARPVVATRVGGLPEVVVSQETGILVEPEDSSGMAQAIAFLLEHPGIATRMGRAARRRAEEVFGWEQCVNAYDTLYRKLIKEASRAQSA